MMICLSTGVLASGATYTTSYPWTPEVLKELQEKQIFHQDESVELDLEEDQSLNQLTCLAMNVATLMGSCPQFLKQPIGKETKKTQMGRQTFPKRPV